MIQPHQLRIGNWVLYDGLPNKVLSIISPAPAGGRFDSKWVVEINPPDSFNVLLEELEPIALDEEWMRRGGFDENKLRIGVYDLVIVLPNSAFYNGCEFPCKYVHQLSNLFFALTQTELEFKQ